MQPTSSIPRAKEPPSLWAVVATALPAMFGAAIANPSGPPVTPSAIPAVVGIALYKVFSSNFCRDVVLPQLPLLETLGLL